MKAKDTPIYRNEIKTEQTVKEMCDNILKLVFAIININGNIFSYFYASRLVKY